MKLFRTQLQSAADLIQAIGREEAVQEVRYMTIPGEPFSMVVRISYRKTGGSQAPFTITKNWCIDGEGVVQECKNVYRGRELYGYLGSLVPFDINSSDITLL